MFKKNEYNSVPEVDGVELSETNVLNPIVDSDIDISDGKSNECYQEIRILDIKGRTYKLNNVPLNGKIYDLKLLIEEETNVPISLQRLIYGGRQLSDDAMSLENAKVKNNTVIHVFQRPPKVNNETSVITATQITNLSHDENSNIAVPIIATNENSSSSQNGNNLHLSMDHGVDSELNDTRRSAKMLALMLLFISTLNLTTLFMILLDTSIETPNKDEQLSITMELVVNFLGFFVAWKGIQGINSLDQDKVKQYCIGLVIVGFLYISIDIYRLVRSVLYEDKDDEDGKDDTVDNDPNSNEKDEGDDYEGEDPVGAATISLFFTLFIWSICFYRAFQFRYTLHVALGNSNENIDNTPTVEAVNVENELGTSEAHAELV